MRGTCRLGQMAPPAGTPDAAAPAEGDGGMADASAPATTFGTTCPNGTPNFCTGAVDFCSVMNPAVDKTGYCTKICSGMPTICPTNWTCLDLALVTGVKELPSICVRPQ